MNRPHTSPEANAERWMPPVRNRASWTRSTWRPLAVGAAALLLICSFGASARAAGLLIADGGFGGVLKIQEQDVQVTINNGVAVTEVSQVFLNTENRIVEALYTFPVPNGASVSNFSMIINGKEMIGEVVEKQRAREIYESYKQTKRDPGLLEQVDYKSFEMRVFPIPAGAEQHVKVTYYQELDYDHDWATYVYPLETVSRPEADQRTTGKFALTLDVKSEIPITEMSSPSHGDDFVIAEHGPQYRRASLETHEGDLSRDVVIAFRVERPRTGIDVVTSKAGSEDGYFQLTLTAGKELEELSRGMDYVFVLDVSGSMAHDGKLRMSRNSIGAFVEALGPEDRFELITFNISPDTLFNTLQPITDEAKSEAVTYLESQRARGGTSLRPALTTAYRYRDADRTLNVVVLSDGMTEQREQRELLELVMQRPSGSRVFCVGIGNEVNRPLLAQLADQAGGLAAFISQGDDFERQAQAFRRKLMRPAVTMPKITLAGVEVYDVEPQTLPDLYHGSPLRVYGRYRDSGNLTARIDGDALGAPFEQSADVALPKANDDNPEIERMWAWHRVQRLMDENRSSGNSTAKVDEIVQLCEGYSIAGEYASFIVLENDGEYRRWKIDRRNASRIQRDRAARAAVRQRLDQLREQTLANLGPQEVGEVADSTTSSSDTSTDATPFRTVSTPTGTPNVSNSASTPRAPRRSGGSMGGGAIDPLTAALALGLIGAAAAAARRKRNSRRRG